MEVYKNIFEASRFVECYNSAHLRSELGLTRALCVGLAMLLGSDYTDGINGVGIVNACEVLTAFCVRPSPHPHDDGTDNSDPGTKPYSAVLKGLREFASWMVSSAAEEKDDAEDDSDPDLKLFRVKHRNQRSRWLRHAAGNFPSEEVMNAYFDPVVDSSNGVLCVLCSLPCVVWLVKRTIFNGDVLHYIYIPCQSDNTSPQPCLWHAYSTCANHHAEEFSFAAPQLSALERLCVTHFDWEVGYEGECARE